MGQGDVIDEPCVFIDTTSAFPASSYLSKIQFTNWFIFIRKINQLWNGRLPQAKRNQTTHDCGSLSISAAPQIPYVSTAYDNFF